MLCNIHSSHKYLYYRHIRCISDHKKNENTEVQTLGSIAIPAISAIIAMHRSIRILEASLEMNEHAISLQLVKVDVHYGN